jgi:hypothetical protein
LIEQSSLNWCKLFRKHARPGGGRGVLMGQKSLDDCCGATLAFSIKRFDASTMILTCPAQRAQVSIGPASGRSASGLKNAV